MSISQKITQGQFLGFSFMGSRKAAKSCTNRCALVHLCERRWNEQNQSVPPGTQDCNPRGCTLGVPCSELGLGDCNNNPRLGELVGRSCGCCVLRSQDHQEAHLSWSLIEFDSGPYLWPGNRRSSRWEKRNRMITVKESGRLVCVRFSFMDRS